jgi:hypothetical protein
MGLPLLAALILWWVEDRQAQLRFWLAAITFSLVGLIALVLFVINRQYGCILASGRQNCLFDGLASLSLFGLCMVLVKVSLANQTQSFSDQAGDERLKLLLVARGPAWG